MIADAKSKTFETLNLKPQTQARDLVGGAAGEVIPTRPVSWKSGGTLVNLHPVTMS